MLKKVISTFFSLVFLLFITAPTILIIVDDAIDIFSISENEEESNEKEMSIEMFFASTPSNHYYLVFTTTENSLEYFDKKYTKQHLNI